MVFIKNQNIFLKCQITQACKIGSIILKFVPDKNVQNILCKRTEHSIERSYVM